MKRKLLRTKLTEQLTIATLSLNRTWIKLKLRDNLVSNFIKVVVPGNTLRVVDIAGIDTEACCGTHCDSTAEVGWIKITKT